MSDDLICCVVDLDAGDPRTGVRCFKSGKMGPARDFAGRDVWVRPAALAALSPLLVAKSKPAPATKPKRTRKRKPRKAAPVAPKPAPDAEG